MSIYDAYKLYWRGARLQRRQCFGIKVEVFRKKSNVKKQKYNIASGTDNGDACHTKYD